MQLETTTEWSAWPIADVVTSPILTPKASKSFSWAKILYSSEELQPPCSNHYSSFTGPIKITSQSTTVFLYAWRWFMYKSDWSLDCTWKRLFITRILCATSKADYASKYIAYSGWLIKKIQQVQEFAKINQKSFWKIQKYENTSWGWAGPSSALAGAWS